MLEDTAIEASRLINMKASTYLCDRLELFLERVEMPEPYPKKLDEHFNLNFSDASN